MDVPPPQPPGVDIVAAGVNPPQASGSSGPISAPDATSAPASTGPLPAAPARAGLAPAIAKLFAGGGIPLPITLNVSYRVLKNPNEIVTVFTDPQTGQEIAQFPPDVIIGLAEFFDQQQGATLDHSA